MGQGNEREAFARAMHPASDANVRGRTLAPGEYAWVDSVHATPMSTMNDEFAGDGVMLGFSFHVDTDEKSDADVPIVLNGREAFAMDRDTAIGLFALLDKSLRDLGVDVDTAVVEARLKMSIEPTTDQFG